MTRTEGDQRGGAPARPAADATLVSRSCEVSDVSFRAFLAARDRGEPRVHWASPAGLELVGGGAAVRLTAEGADRFDRLRADAATVFADTDVGAEAGSAATRPRMLGGVAFDAAHEPDATWAGFPAASFLLPAVQLTRDHEGTYLTVTRYAADATAAAVDDDLTAARESLADLPMMRPSGGKPGVAATRWRTDRAEWVEQVERVRERIRAGDLRKVVLATALDVDLASPVDIPDTLERLRRTYPECYRFLVQPSGGDAFFGPPPERLVKLDGRRVETEALAGSMPRGDSHETDADNARSLLESEKLQHEQRLVVDTIAEQLSAYGDVREGEQGVRKLTNIQHLRTPIEADLDGPEHVLTLVEALHPTPAMGGLPLAEALATIRGTETFDRGWYASPVGWFDGNGDGEFAVGIRSCVAGDDHATLFAGNGIVGDSDPEAEWEELQPKVRPVLDELERDDRTDE
ncbi:isochorismate synthase [Candidatus Halobonum tyrrellensis]|uniref:isochorismate synthase n=1 Tax=Candidatus Halobonum tyrrellensis G22 TaxID=1324957 RepID=V4HER5_9EURY|nr:isochorismate synthase [Candidatus Halobonum tyrrellensis]ESP88593.1 isochorismate synthase [Candidatus Halobonum tyrrellensis G22]